MSDMKIDTTFHLLAFLLIRDIMCSRSNMYNLDKICMLRLKDKEEKNDCLSVRNCIFDM